MVITMDCFMVFKIDKSTRIYNFTFRSSLSSMQKRGVKFETFKSNNNTSD